ncbi:MAG: hypothetical protein R3Y58_11000 [Eubacteriales bacterium]
MNIIEELYFGNIDPNGHCCDEKKNYQAAMETVADIEEILMKSLDGELKNLFIKYENAYSTLLGESSVSHFTMGFKLGARIGIELCSDDIKNCLKDDI